MPEAGRLHGKTDKRRKAPQLPSQIDHAIAAAEDKKAVDLVVLDLRKAAGFTDFFVMASGTNTRQVRAIADGVMKRWRRRGQAGAYRGLRPIRVDSARLLRFRRARVRARNAGVLRPRAAVGERDRIEVAAGR